MKIDSLCVFVVLCAAAMDIVVAIKIRDHLVCPIYDTSLIFTKSRIVLQIFSEGKMNIAKIHASNANTD